MKLWITVVLTMILLAGCVPVEMATPEASQAVSPAMPSTEATLPPEQPTATIPQPAEGTVAPGAVEAVEAAKEFLVIQLGVDKEEIQVVQVTAVEWPDACLGIPATDEMCAQVITPGFVITLETTVDGVGEYFAFHTDESGEALRVLPVALVKARQALAELTGLLLEEIRLVRFEAVDWRDSCLGVVTPGVGCMEVITPGYLIVLEAGGALYEYHTNQDGSRVLLAELGSGGTYPDS